MVWSGHYHGVVDGAFGKRTRDAIVAYQTSVKAPANGLVDAAQLAAMSGRRAKGPRRGALPDIHRRQDRRENRRAARKFSTSASPTSRAACGS